MQGKVKGAYIVRLDLTVPHILGVAKKVRSQVLALSSFASSMDLFYPAEGCVRKNDEVIHNYGVGGLWRRMTYYFLFYFFISKQSLDVDFIYIRYQRSSPIFLYMLARLKIRNPGLVVLVELPSYPYHAESTSFRDKMFGLIDRFSRPFLRFFVDRIVTFSREKKIFGIPTIQTDNGVDVGDVSLLPSPDVSGHIRLLGLANLSFWHGYDRIISGLNRYYSAGNKRVVIFDIVGTGLEFDRLQNDVLQYGLTEYVRFHGALHGSQLDNMIGQSLVGISSIGMHRLKVDTSNLKSREFCARGLPFVIAYEDRDFCLDLPYVFHASANDDPIDIEALISFYENLKVTQPNYPEKMRSYAESKLTWQAKMEPVITVISDLLTSGN